MSKAKRIKFHVMILFAAALGFSATIQFYPTLESEQETQNEHADFSYFSPSPEIALPFQIPKTRAPSAVVAKSTKQSITKMERELSPIQLQLLQAFNELDPQQKKWIDSIKANAKQDHRTKALLVFFSGIKANEIAKNGTRVFDSFKNSLDFTQYKNDLIKLGNNFNEHETQAFKNSFYEVLIGHLDGEIIKDWLLKDVEKIKSKSIAVSTQDIESFIKVSSQIESLSREEKIRIHKTVIASLRSPNPEALQEMSDWFLNN